MEESSLVITWSRMEKDLTIMNLRRPVRSSFHHIREASHLRMLGVDIRKKFGVSLTTFAHNTAR